MVELWWLGQSGFRLRDLATGARVFCDPFLTVDAQRTWQAPIDPSELARQADVVLVSHEHSDHFDRPALEAAAAVDGAEFTLVLPRPLVAEARALGLPAERVVGAQPESPISIDGVRIWPVPACHGVNTSDAYTLGEALSDGLVRFLGYVVEIGGTRVYHAGDCIPYAGQVERLRELRPNVACLPINGRDFFRESEHNIVGNMDFREAARLASDIGAEVLVPMHWEMYETNRGYPGDLTGFVAERYPRLTVLVIGRGQTVTLGVYHR
jgi:L-ascorbate metabolism protein UlaG (beta-lactamase superfamily)